MYHAHSGIQRADGIFGAIVVRQNNDQHAKLYDYDLSDHVIVLNDWFNVTAETMFNSFTRIRKSSAVPSGILINGKGAIIFTDANSITPRATFKVNKGYRYRFRLISAGVMACPIQFSIQNHKFKVIASDGQPFKAENDVEALVIFAGIF